MELAVHEIKRHKYFCLHSEEVPIRSNEHIESYFMQVCLMNRGECFGIGESELKIVVQPSVIYFAFTVSQS
jgi:hypothetical protein